MWAPARRISASSQLASSDRSVFLHIVYGGVEGNRTPVHNRLSFISFTGVVVRVCQGHRSGTTPIARSSNCLGVARYTRDIFDAGLS